MSRQVKILLVLTLALLAGGSHARGGRMRRLPHATGQLREPNVPDISAIREDRFDDDQSAPVINDPGGKKTGQWRCAVKENDKRPDKIKKRLERKIEKKASKSSRASRQTREVGRRKRSRRNLRINVRIHVIMSKYGGNITMDRIKDQIGRLNSAYSGNDVPRNRTSRKDRGAFDTRLRFRLLEVIYYDNTTDYFYCDYYHKDIKKRLVTTPTSVLNLITCDPFHDQAGWATFPYDFLENSTSNAVFIHQEAFYGSEGKRFPRWSHGNTLTHEIGHFLGLYHTFHNETCHNAEDADKGDYITDTPCEKTSASSCDDIGRDTCTGDGESLPTLKPYEGKDPITNFMDYTPDRCMTEFTPGQGTFMRIGVHEHRPGLCGKKGCAFYSLLPNGAG